MELYEHQKDALDRMHNGCILWGDVGLGKTLVALEYYKRNEAPKRLIVITTAKKRDSGDWEQEADLVGVARDVLTVDSWNNLSKYKDVTDAFFVFDEQRLVGSGVWVRSFLRIADKNRWILLSATPGDVWLDYIPVFVANGFYRNRTEFIREHVVYSHFGRYPKLERFVGVAKLRRLRDSLLVEMPYERETTRNLVDLEVEFDKKEFLDIHRIRWNFEENRPIRDAGEMFYLMRKSVNSDPSRLEAIQLLWFKHPKMIIFYNFDYELEILRGLDGNVAEWNGHKHEPIPDTDSWFYLVQYTAGAEGWNCTDTDAMVFYSLSYSYKTYYQAMGRIDRLNNTHMNLHYYRLVSRSFIDRGIMQALRNKQDFNEKAVLGRF